MERCPVENMVYGLGCEVKPYFTLGCFKGSKRPLGLLSGPSPRYLKIWGQKQLPCNLAFQVYLSFWKVSLMRKWLSLSRTSLPKIIISRGSLWMMESFDDKISGDQMCRSKAGLSCRSLRFEFNKWPWAVWNFWIYEWASFDLSKSLVAITG